MKMQVMRKTVSAGLCKVCVEYPRRLFDHMSRSSSREPRSRSTSKQKADANHRQKKEHALLMLYGNFHPGDLYVTLTCKEEYNTLNKDAIKRYVKTFLERLRIKYKKYGSTISYIRNLELDSKGRWHIHMVDNAISDKNASEIVRDAWRFGSITKITRLAFNMRMRDIASYITKDPSSSQDIIWSSFRCSKGLRKPEKSYEVVKTDVPFVYPEPPVGSFVIDDLYHTGILGYYEAPYRRYTIVSLEGFSNTEGSYHQIDNAASVNTDEPVGEVLIDDKSEKPVQRNDRIVLKEEQRIHEEERHSSFLQWIIKSFKGMLSAVNRSITQIMKLLRWSRNHKRKE